MSFVNRSYYNIYMRKLRYGIAFLAFLFFIIHSNAFAENKFSLSSNIVYSFDTNGTVTVAQNISIRNKTNYTYLPTFILSPGIRDIKNLKVSNSSGQLPILIKEDAMGNETIQITFPARKAGTGKTNDFKIMFNTQQIAKKLGNIWQISIPGIENPGLYDIYSVSVRVPKSFGGLSVIKASSQLKTYPSQETGKSEITFQKSAIDKSGIFLEFGNKQYYSFKLNYRIANNNFFPSDQEMALPRSTNYQDIQINNINPQPSNVKLDNTGNWIAVYRLLPGQKKDIVVTGVAQVGVVPRKTSITTKERKIYTQAQQYWETDNAQIQALAEKLKTPENIYKFVTTKLSYNYSKVARDNKRLGAYGSLNNSKYAVCLEFTDLFIAIARAANIPARMVEGYAYTENPRLKPLSKVKDILHTWPEYYDFNKQAWIAVDPTWGSTTFGSDYFNSIDFERIAFVINGENSTYPIPAGGYKIYSNSKDVLVSFTDKSAYKEKPVGELIDNLPQFSLAGFDIRGNVVVKNTGTGPLENFKLIVSSQLSPRQKIYSVGMVPPYGYIPVAVQFNKTPFLTNNSYQVTIRSVDNSPVQSKSQLRHIINIGFIPDQKLILLGGVTIFGFTILFIITIKTWSIFVSRRKG